MTDENKTKQQLISELKQLRERVAAQGQGQMPAFVDRRFRGVLDSLPVVIAFVDSGRRLLFCNKAFEEKFGTRKAPLSGKLLEEALDPGVYLKISPSIEKAFLGEGVAFELSSGDLNRGKGTRRMLRLSCIPHPDPTGGYGFIALGTDITELKKAEEALRQSEEWFRNLAEHIPGLSIQGYRTTGEVVYWNNESIALFGYSTDEAVGKKLTDLIAPPDLEPMFERILEAGKKVKKSGEIVPSGELILLDRQGRNVPVHATHTAVVIEGREPLLFCINFDLSDRKRIEEELLNAKKLEAIGILAGGIAHDFNNLLFVILGNLSMAQMKLSGEDPAFRHFAEAEKACLRAKDLTQKFITFSSGGGPLRNKVSIGEMVENAVSLVLSGSNIGSELNIPRGLLKADIDEDQMRQVLTGIIANAKEAMPRGGTLYVNAENVDIPNTGALREGQYVKIVIRDEGTGIPEENLAKIFDPYFSTKYRGSQKGMGFGLAIAHSVIKRHNGNIKVESRLDEGTVITIIIPASTATDVAHQVSTGSGHPGRKRVLIMDDEEMLVDLLKTMIEHLGFEAGVAMNGEQAVEMYADSLEKNRKWDVLILDLTVKGGMGGRDTLKKLQYLDTEVKAIVSSGYSSDPIMSDYQSYGFKDILSKPYALDQLKNVLNRVLSGESV